MITDQHDPTAKFTCEIAAEDSTAILVEHRDEVFARIATDMLVSGMRIVRAKSATEALSLCREHEPRLIVANVDLPDESGWLLAGKLQFVDQRIHVWLYQPQSTSYDRGMARFLHVDELIDYAGDLLGLSDSIVSLISDLREPVEAACEVTGFEELAAA